MLGLGFSSGGVYCGTTAAVAIATDKRQTDFSDDVLSLEGEI